MTYKSTIFWVLEVSILIQFHLTAVAFSFILGISFDYNLHDWQNVMTKILFLSQRGNGRSRIAEGFAQRYGPSAVEVISAGMKCEPICPAAVESMAREGIDISRQASQSLADIQLSTIDLVIALAREAALPCTALPGVPAVVRWDIEDALALPQSDQQVAIDLVRDEIHHRVRDLFSEGYLSALLAIKKNNELVLDHFSTGIMAHDTRRIITWFNKAAERITGFSRQEVIGRDCHEVLGKFCGGQCLFNGVQPNFDCVNYPIRMATRDGNHRKIEMTVVAIRNGDGTLQGVLAQFHDITEVTQLRHTLKKVQSFHGLIGSHESMHQVYDLVSDLAGSDFTVLIQGESGTGKELVAGAIHGESRRRGKPFVTVNCGALPEGILESELFGHVRGAFTGAVRDKKGRFELADGGTLFLDEVAELTPNMQVKLLRVLQEGTFERVGDEKLIKVDVRLISATNKDLKAMVHKGKFREDLFYRLCVVPMTLPPLRERRTDIPLLVNNFIEHFSHEARQSIRGISPEAIHCMMDYLWPGNVRELQNAIRYGMVKCKDNYLHVENLPPEILANAAKIPSISPRLHGKLTTAAVGEAMAKADGNKVRAAKLLGVGRATLYRFLKISSIPVRRENR
jgi:sigma-54 dependent transcriptional regulator, acetoin dehydrogenase operon transcriptional activator AcoR